MSLSTGRTCTRWAALGLLFTAPARGAWESLAYRGVFQPGDFSSPPSRRGSDIWRLSLVEDDAAPLTGKTAVAYDWLTPASQPWNMINTFAGGAPEGLREHYYTFPVFESLEPVSPPVPAPSPGEGFAQPAGRDRVAVPPAANPAPEQKVFVRFVIDNWTRRPGDAPPPKP